MDPETVQTYLSRTFLGNTLENYLMAAGIFLLALLGLKLLKLLVINRLHTFAKRTATDIDDFLINLLRHLGPIVYVIVALYVSSRSLVISASLEKVIQIFFVVVLSFKIVQILQEISAFFLQKWASRAEPEDPTSAMVVKNLSKVIRVMLWVGGLVFVLDNLGINITSVVAGLGIGGIAVALAAQAVLGDAFSSFAIFMDKPFKVGDFIIVGEMLGTVEHVGFKTTRVRSLGGEQLVFSNTDLTNSRIRNYKQMDRRRVLFTLGVIYQTSLEQTKAIPQILKEVIQRQELVEFDRAHFKAYGDFSLIYEIVYYILSPDYNTYMDIQQAINFEIKEEFEKRNIEFAYPTQQLYFTQAEPTP